jgi:hypothetical protein
MYPVVALTIELSGLSTLDGQLLGPRSAAIIRPRLEPGIPGPAGVAVGVIIRMPAIISSVNTTAIILDLAMIVMTMMTTIIGARGNGSGAAGGIEHGGAAGKKTRFVGT